MTFIITTNNNKRNNRNKDRDEQGKEDLPYGAEVKNSQEFNYSKEGGWQEV